MTSSRSIARGRADERAREGDALLLAAGELVGAVVLAALEPEPAEQRPCRLCLGLVARDAVAAP